MISSLIFVSVLFVDRHAIRLRQYDASCVRRCVPAQKRRTQLQHKNRVGAAPCFAIVKSQTKTREEI